MAVLTSTCLGAVDPAVALLREGAEPGWQIAVTGRLGGAAAALHLLHDPGSVQAKSVPAALAAAWTQRLRRPQPRLAAAAALVEAGIRVCLDVSDGVYVDAERVLGEGVGAVIDIGRLPIEAGIRDAFPDSWREVAGGGEDYELLFAGPPHTVADACRRIIAGGLGGGRDRLHRWRPRFAP